MVYVDAENGNEEMHRRAHAFGIYEGFYHFDGNMAESLVELRKELRKPSLVVLDSFRALYPYCEEDQSKDVLPVLRALQSLARETSCGILVLHHTTKGGGTFRGSGEFQNRPEITVTMKRDGHGNRFLDWEKCRMGVEPERKYLRLLDTNGALSWVEGRDIPAGRPGGDLDL
jgi:predicted ATP-dependent serine protease